jgi:hypothetical protein
MESFKVSMRKGLGITGLNPRSPRHSELDSGSKADTVSDPESSVACGVVAAATHVAMNGVRLLLVFVSSASKLGKKLLEDCVYLF